jgi:hypothetical protein
MLKLLFISFCWLWYQWQLGMVAYCKCGKIRGFVILLQVIIDMSEVTNSFQVRKKISHMIISHLHNHIVRPEYAMGSTSYRQLVAFCANL